MASGSRTAAQACVVLGTLLLLADPLPGDDCERLGGSIVGGECQVSGSVMKSGVFAIEETLHVLGTGRILVPGMSRGGSLVLDIQGDLLMDPPAGVDGSVIQGDVAEARGVGASIQVKASRDLVLHGGARITSRQVAGVSAGGEAGSIVLAAGRNIVLEDGSQVAAGGGAGPAGKIALLAPRGKVEIAGLVSSESVQDDDRRPGGGPITVEAGCKLVVLETGVVSSRGSSAPADLVHLQGGCDVVVLGLVESSGSGSVEPGHPAARVEVWSGNDLTIDRIEGARGQVVADSGGSPEGGTASSIELIAGGDLSIDGSGEGAFAVHANALCANSSGGQVTALSSGGKVLARGLAVQADAKCGGDGGQVWIEAWGDVSLVSASVFARGDSTLGGDPRGGRVAIRSFNGTVSWTDPGAAADDAGDVRPTGDGVPAEKAGSITLTDCAAGPVDRSGVDFPFLGSSATSPVDLPEACGGAPLLPENVELPVCDPGLCGAADLSDFCFLSSVQSELDSDGERFPGNLGPDVVVDAGQGESIQAALDLAADSNGDGFVIVGVVARSGGLPGGNSSQSLSIAREYPLPFALVGCGVTLHDPRPSDSFPTAAVRSSASAPPDGKGSHILVLGLHADGSDIAGWWVEGDGRHLRNVNASHNLIGIEISGNHSILEGSSLEENDGVAVQVEGDGNRVTGAGVFSNQGMGILVVGNSNVLQKNEVGDRDRGNGDLGMAVSGMGNVIDGNGIFANSGTGLDVEGDGNTVTKNDLGDAGKGNAGDGLHLTGAGNLLVENRSYANRGDGFEVRNGTAESPNVLRRNLAGDLGKENLGNGFLIGGAGNGPAKPVEIDENSSKHNLKAGFKVIGSGHELRKDVCEENGGCDFDVDPGNLNDTGNRIDGKVISGTTGSPFPAGCLDAAR